MRTLRQVEEQFRLLDAREGRSNIYFDKNKLKKAMAYQNSNKIGGIRRWHSSLFWDVLRDDISETQNPPIQQINKIDTKKEIRKLAENFPKRIKERNLESQFKTINEESKKMINKEVKRRSSSLSNRIEYLVKSGDEKTSHSIFKDGNQNSGEKENTPSINSKNEIKEDTKLINVQVLPNKEEETKIQTPPIGSKKKKISRYDREDYYLFQVKIHKNSNFEDGLFDVVITQEDVPNKSIILKDLTLDLDNFIVFDEPSINIFNPVRTLPWIKQPRDLLDRTLIIEVNGTYPTKTRVAKSIIKFDRRKKRQDKKEDLNTPTNVIEEPFDLVDDSLKEEILSDTSLTFKDVEESPLRTNVQENEEINDSEDDVSTEEEVPKEEQVMKEEQQPKEEEEKNVERKSIKLLKVLDENLEEEEISPFSKKQMELKKMRENIKKRLEDEMEKSNKKTLIVKNLRKKEIL